jgi:hypothetical protein
VEVADFTAPFCFHFRQGRVEHCTLVHNEDLSRNLISPEHRLDRLKEQFWTVL